MFARGFYITTKIIGDSPQGGELELYILTEEQRRGPASALEEMMDEGVHPGIKLAVFKEGVGITVFDKDLYGVWYEYLRAELGKISDNKIGAERILILYFLSQMAEGLTST